MRVAIYIEGGGDREATRRACRKGFVTFFLKMLPRKNQPKVVVCGGREQTFDYFRNQVRAYAEMERAILLVDSEGPVKAGDSPRRHLDVREQGRWVRPEGTTDDQFHLMVQCMESWFIADVESLADYYGRNFKRAKLPKPHPKTWDVESIDKERLQVGLEEATKETSKGRYHKTRHGFDILAALNPDRVCRGSRHAAMLRETLVGWLDDRPA